MSIFTDARDNIIMFLIVSYWPLEKKECSETPLSNTIIVALFQLYARYI